MSSIISAPTFGIPRPSTQFIDGVPIVPLMTAENAPVDWLVSDSEHFSTAPAWHAFDYITHASNAMMVWSGWLSNGTALPHWVAIRCPYPLTINGYLVAPWTADNYNTRTPQAWLFQASHDGSNWATLDSRSGLSTGWTQWTDRRFSFTPPAVPYRWYRWYWTANGGNAYVGVSGLNLLGRFR